MRKYIILIAMTLTMMFALNACGDSAGASGNVEATTEASPEGLTVQDSADIEIPEDSTGGIREKE